MVASLPNFFRESDDHPRFFISIYSSDRSKQDLTQPKLWSLKLSALNAEWEPLKIVEVRSKTEWQPFLPYINQWTREYIVIFPSTDAQSIKASDPLKLILSNLEAKSVFNF